MTAMRVDLTPAELALNIILSLHTPIEGPKLPRGNGKQAPVPVCSVCRGELDRIVWPCFTYQSAIEGLQPDVDIKRFCKDAVDEWSSEHETSDGPDWSIPRPTLSVVDGGKL